LFGSRAVTASYASDGDIVTFSKMLLLCDESKSDNGVDEEFLVKAEKRYSLKRCAFMIRAGSSETVVVHCGWKATIWFVRKERYL